MATELDTKQIQNDKHPHIKVTMTGLLDMDYLFSQLTDEKRLQFMVNNDLKRKNKNDFQDVLSDLKDPHGDINHEDVMWLYEGIQAWEKNNLPENERGQLGKKEDPMTLETREQIVEHIIDHYGRIDLAYIINELTSQVNG